MSAQIETTPVLEGYKEVTVHLEDELRRVDLLLELASAARPRNGSEANVPAAPPVDVEELVRSEERIAARLSKTSALTPLARLRVLFQLSPLEYDVLLICMAPAVDPRYGALYAALQNDMERPCATPALIALLLKARGFGVAAVREILSEHAPLLRYGLVRFRSAPGDFTMLARPLVADERIVDFALDTNYLDSLGVGLLFSQDTDAPGAAVLATEIAGEALLNGVATELEEQGMPCLAYLHGMPGQPFRETAGEICRRLGVPLLRFEFGAVLREARDPREFVRRALREAVLFQGGLLVEGFDADATPEATLLRAVFFSEAARLPGLYFIAGTEPILRDVEAGRFRYFSLHLPLPDYATRRRLWSEELSARDVRPDGITVEELAASFRFTALQISRAVSRARDAHRFLLGAGDSGVLPLQTLLDGCRAESNRKLADLAIRVPTRFGWSDIVLPSDSLRQLYEIEAHVRHAEVVYDEWGFENQILAGRGLNVLFSGPSGTGKTMAASILAGELKLELFKIDLSTVVSKYIGETEKNLSRIFQEAETSNAVLFFDEADALFGKRSEVKDAHDRNANIEVGYLLQKMEEYGGISILATNLRENIDEAFLRRLHSIVEFPFPGPPERERIWRIAFPAHAPREEDIDYKFLADRVKLSGGGIKNVVLNAAFMAAREQKHIAMRHLVNSARREYQKDGRNLLGSDLGKYASMVDTGEGAEG